MQTYIRLFVLALICSSPILLQAATPKNQPGSTSSSAITPCSPGVVYVKLKAGSTVIGAASGKGAQIQSTGASKFDRTLRTLNMRTVVPFDANAPRDQITHDLGIDRMYCIYYDNHSIDPNTALHLLLATGEVDCGSPRYMFPLSKRPNDPQISSEYALTNMNVFAAWDVTTGDPSVLIADVDDGFNTAHQDLKNAITQGWDIVGAVSTASGGTFKPDNDPLPDNVANSHGSHTAGCIAASGDNNLGIAGVAYGCKILAIKAAGSDNDNIGGISGGYEAIHYASTHGARVINCSWGGPISGVSTGFFNSILQEAISRNVLVVAAAGNDRADLAKNPAYPACGPGVLSVGATDETDAPCVSFTSYGHPVSVWAPGRQILSCNYPGTNGYNAEDGTSFSSPLVAGLAGLVVSVHPTWPARFIARQIIQTCDNVVDPQDQFDFWGRVNAGNAISAPSGPGLMISSYSLDGVGSDSLGAIGKSTNLKITFKNVVSTGTNLTATLLTRTGFTAGGNAIATLGSMVVDASVAGDFQITRTGTYSEGNMPVRFFVTDGGSYSDTLELLLPLKKLPGFVMDRSASFGQSIKRISNTAAWATFGFQQTQFKTVAQYARENNGVWSDTVILSDGVAAAYDVEARDSLTAWFGTGANSVAEIIFTRDGGKIWNTADASPFTPFVNSIHFFDAKNGVCIGDPISQVWGIGFTSDGGDTWDLDATPTSSQSPTEASWNNATCWVGDNGWFGTNSARIWRTTNRGRTWASAKTGTVNTYAHSLGVGFDDDAIHGFAVFRKVTGTSGATTGLKAVQLSTDGGATWKVVKLPVAGMTPGAVKFVPGTHTAILTSDSGIFRTIDYGITWTSIGMPVSFQPLDGDLSIYSGEGLMTASFVSNSDGIATYQEAAAVPTLGLSVNPGTLNFGTVVIPNSNSLPATIKNDGSGPATINGITIITAPTAFTASNVSFPKTLVAGETLDVSVTFQPTVVGMQTATLVITLSDGTTKQVSLTGVGAAQGGVAEANGARTLTLGVSSNPFRGATEVQYDLPVTATVRLSIFDVVGREVAMLVSGSKSEGHHTALFDAHTLPVGVYYCVLQTESGQRASRAITLTK